VVDRDRVAGVPGLGNCQAVTCRELGGKRMLTGPALTEGTERNAESHAFQGSKKKVSLGNCL